MERWDPPAWALPLIVAALVVPPFAGFAIGGVGTGVGVAIGFAMACALIWFAVRSSPNGPIELARDDPDAPLLAFALAPIGLASTANEIATLAEAGEGRTGGGYSVLVLAPAQATATQRWLGDEEPGRVAASERLAVSVANLTTAGCHAEGRVVDQDPAMALEDAAAEHGARRVVFVVDDESHDGLIEKMTARLDVPVHRVSGGR